jgi:hypothetical protein
MLRISALGSIGLMVFLFVPPAGADGGVTFRDVVPEEASGLAGYHRTESATAPLYREITQRPVFTVVELADTPNKWDGAPGVAVFDHDGDGDLDLYVTNGPGSDNSLFSSQLRETGELTFLDLAVPAGVAARDQDSSGVCYGDTDNDGDPDLFVLSAHGPNRLFENNGDGTFLDVTAPSGLGDDATTSVACSFGDVDGDGLLDVAVANNTVDWGNMLGIGGFEPFLYSQANQLFRNTGGNVFEEISRSSGIQELTSFVPPIFDGEPTATWAIALVDYDLDGDVDVVHADDQGGIPPAAAGGLDRGLLFVLENDGEGHFTDVTADVGTNKPGGWMGLSFGDLDADGDLDFFATNVGDWGQTTISPLDPVYGNFLDYQLGDLASRWFLGDGDGGFTDPGVGDLVATPFGWGTSMVDYDNDADLDILYHGGLAFPPFVNPGNPGIVLRNDGAADFEYDLEALAGSTDHGRRVVHGVATGDLDDDGFVDVASVASARVQESIPLTPYNVQWGSPIDGIPAYEMLFTPTDTPGVWVFSGYEENADGDLSVELNSGDNGNRWVKVTLRGSVGLTPSGRVNRDGIGAVVGFTTAGGRSTLRPVLGGSSYASQDALELGFGLGDERWGRIEVLWPGGVKNRLYLVRAGERVTFPEIPCSFDGEWPTLGHYARCLRRSLRDLVDAGTIDRREKGRFFASAILAYLEEHAH